MRDHSREDEKCAGAVSAPFTTCPLCLELGLAHNSCSVHFVQLNESRAMQVTFARSLNKGRKLLDIMMVSGPPKGHSICTVYLCINISLGEVEFSMRKKVSKKAPGVR